MMFVPVKNKKVYQHVMEQIQNMLMNGQLKVGDRLPSERELSEQLLVSRNSIREALRALEIIGLVESKQGEGNFITGSIESSFLEPLSIMFMLNHGNPKDILDLRRIIELEAATLAAQRIQPEDMEELKKIMESLRNACCEKESAEYDAQLHMKIAEISGNYLIKTLLSATASLMGTFIKNARGMILREAENRDFLMEQHQKICDALYEKNPEKASQAMKDHLETIHSIMKLSE